MKITVDIEKLDKASLLAALTEIDREISTRYRVYPKWIAEGKITEQAALNRTAALVVALQACAAIAKGMIAEVTKIMDAEITEHPVSRKGAEAQSPESKTIPFRKDPPPASTDRAERDAKARKMNDAINTARAAILAALTHPIPADGTTGHILCPVCKTGTLNYAVAPNGHVRAACTGADCVRWVE